MAGPYVGTRDFYPEEMNFRNRMFGVLRRVCESYGYVEYSAPLLEPISLYESKSSEEIVNDQVYRFIDRGEREVAIRPEMTPTLARMVSSRIMELVRPVRWYSIANFMRYERPGKGRLREFFQLNADLMGPATPAADAEILSLLVDILTAFGAKSSDFKLRLSDRRLFDSYVKHSDKEVSRGIGRLLDKREKIGDTAFAEELAKIADADLVKRVNSFLTIKASDLSELGKNGAIDPAVGDHLNQVIEILAAQGKAEFVEFDPGIVRGFDYYTGLIFEVQDTHPENRRAICGGGRYDRLLGQMGKQEVPAIGFGLGDVTLEQFLTTRGLLATVVDKVGCFFILFPETRDTSLKIASDLRRAGILVETSLDTSVKIGKQMEAADKKNRKFVLMQGGDELARGVVRVKNLLTGEQVDVKPQDLAEKLR
ncbi:MAG: histidine--tRNA ligase [Spirochaetia bacterium]|nr:histidine--tRNA ligase [Spirochaetia bacterium]